MVSADDVVAARLAGERRDAVVTFGFADDADYQIRDYVGKRNGSQFVLARRGEAGDVVEMPVPGRHNAKNAAAAAAMALEIGVPFAAVRAALGGFGGVARRFQFRGERDGVTFVDDYAHLPGEVAHMIDAAREGDWAHVIVVFQPHRYTRTAALWRDFADVFAGADTVVLTDIYGFNETPQPGVSGRLILRGGARRAPRPARGLPPATRRPRPARAEDRATRRRRADARRRRSHDGARRVVGARGMNAVDTGEAVAVELERALPGAVERDVPLASLTTYHLGGPVSTLVRARSLDALAAVARVVAGARAAAAPRGTRVEPARGRPRVHRRGRRARGRLRARRPRHRRRHRAGHGAGRRRGPVARARPPHRRGRALGPRVLRRASRAASAARSA